MIVTPCADNRQAAGSLLTHSDRLAAELADERARYVRAEDLARELVALASTSLSPPAEVFLEQVLFAAHRDLGLLPDPDPDEHYGTRRPRRADPGEWARLRDGFPLRGFVVYVIRDGSGAVLYVGQTRRPRSRLRSHWRTQDWWPDPVDVELHPVADELAARLLEYRLTGDLRPRHSQVTDYEVGLLARLGGAL